MADTLTRPAPADAQATALKLWVVLARAYAAVARHAEADAARHGLAATEFGVLEALYHKGPLRHGELQDKVLVTSGGITYLVDRLAARGLVERRECVEDRRVRYVALTAAGETLMREAFDEHARSVSRAVAGLSPDEQARATELLRALGQAAATLPCGRPAG